MLAGHIVGGIESSARNIFFIKTGTQSDATSRVFRVLLVRDISTGVEKPAVVEREVLAVHGEPGSGELFVTVDLERGGVAKLDLLDSSGRLVRPLLAARIPAGAQRMHVNVQDLAPGAYLLRLQAGDMRRVVRFVR